MAPDVIPVYPGWETVRKIGSGSYGAVYEIEREVFGKKEKSALKVLSVPRDMSEVEELAANGYDRTGITKHFDSVLSDIVHEYQFMADLKGSSNIVDCDDIRYTRKVSGVGWDIYIKMELLTPLTRTLSDPIPEDQVLKAGMDLCKALILCEKRNIIHRDIKPQNIFVSRDGEYKLGDFGIAKTIDRTSGGTKAGTYSYMAPEINNNEPYGHSADIYSLGMTLYWMLNDRRMPFLPLPPAVPTVREKEEALYRRFRGDDLPAPANGSRALQHIVLKACAFHPADRYHTAEEFLSDLAYYERTGDDPAVDSERFSNGKNEEIPTTTTGKKRKRRPVIGVILGVTALICLLSVGAWFLFGVDTGIIPKPVPTISVAMPAPTEIPAVLESPVISTPIPTLAPTPEPTPEPTPSPVVFGAVKRGETVSFGSYEQDNNDKNGQEAIEWLVLDVQEDRALLLSRYALDSQPFHHTHAYIDWASSSLRRWLNNEFYSIAFSEEEKSAVVYSAVPADRNPVYSSEIGSSTEDNVFLLSVLEMRKYFSTAEESLCNATEYTKARNPQAISQLTGGIRWWLRTPGPGNDIAAFVSNNGIVDERGDNVSSTGECVRPAIWVSVKNGRIDPSSNTTYGREDLFSADAFQASIRAAAVGEYVTFGSYEQDNNEENGKEGIEWLILDIQRDKALLLSRYALDSQRYNLQDRTVAWEECSLRGWLNGTFLDEAFSPLEQTQLYQTKTTSDSVSLLTVSDAKEYFTSNKARQCKPTAYAEAKGTYASDSAYQYSCWWWLSNPSTALKAPTVRSNGEIDEGGDQVNSYNRGVRPAIWVKLSGESDSSAEADRVAQSFAGAVVGDVISFGYYEQDNEITNGKEEIEWQILDLRDGKALLISKNALDNQPFHSSSTSTSWESCSLRTWLNNTFLRKAFSMEKQELILPTRVSADQNPSFASEPGAETTDKIFLLSATEVEKYFQSNFSRQCHPSDYAVAQGAYSSSPDGGNCWWWLRTSGNNNVFASFVHSEGNVDLGGRSVLQENIAVRPAMWLSVEEQ